MAGSHQHDELWLTIQCHPGLTALTGGIHGHTRMQNAARILAISMAVCLRLGVWVKDDSDVCVCVWVCKGSLATAVVSFSLSLLAENGRMLE